MSYLIQIGKNLLKDQYKHEAVRQKHQNHVTQLEDKPVAQPDQDLHHSELQRTLEEGILALPEKCREVFILSRFEGLRNSEIAARFGLSKKTVENQLYHALKLLRETCKDFL